MSTPGIEITPHLNYAADFTRHLDPVELMSPKSRWSIGRALMSHYTITRQPAIESEITRNYNLILANHNAKGRELANVAARLHGDRTGGRQRLLHSDS